MLERPIYGSIKIPKKIINKVKTTCKQKHFIHKLKTNKCRKH